VAEGLVDADGNYVAAADKTDAFGHAQLGGAAECPAPSLVEEGIPGVKARVAKPGMAQRCAAHAGSKTDADEAFLAGQGRGQAAVNGETDKMVTLLRGDGDHYTVETGLAPLSDIANGVKKLPREWINEDGISMNFQFVRYAQPLIQGEGGRAPGLRKRPLPAFAHLDPPRALPRSRRQDPPGLRTLSHPARSYQGRRYARRRPGNRAPPPPRAPRR
jgi:hypothetical protein